MASSRKKRSSPLRTVLRDRRGLFGLIVLSLTILLALLAPWLAPTDPGEKSIVLRLAPVSWDHWLGCDVFGGDVVTDLLYGARTSLYVGFLTVVLSMTLGTSLGLISGYRGGVVDMILMRIVDVLLAFPGILLAMALSAILGPSVHNVVLAISATGWISSARLVRGEVLSLREREFVQCSVALGSSTQRTLFFHVLPSIVSPLIVHSTFSLAGVIVVEASLSFLGLGAQGGGCRVGGDY